jgi:Na+/H+ antiporter NhaC
MMEDGGRLGKLPKPALIAIAVIAVAAVTALLPAGDQRYLFEQTLGPLTDSTLSWAAGRPGFDEIESLSVILLEDSRVFGPEELPPTVRLLFEERFAAFQDGHGKSVSWLPAHTVTPPLSIVFRSEEGQTRATALWRSPGGAPERLERVEPYFQRLAILPPLLAIVLALTFRRVLISLFAGVWLGATLVPWLQSGVMPEVAGASSFPNPLLGLWRFASVYFWERSILDRFRIDIIGFVAILVATVGLMTRSGAVAGMVDLIVRFARTVRTTRLATALMGIAIFFDDYTNCIVVGNTMRPLTDRRRISREKLAYLVDSTAAPIAGIMMLSTWVAYEVSTFAPQLTAVGVTIDPYEIFLRTVPFRFYCLFTLVLVFASTLLRRDFGPMLTAERRAATTGQVIREGATPLVATRVASMREKEGVPRRWANAAIPLLTVLTVTMIQIVRIGLANLDGPVNLLDGADLRRVLQETDTAHALFQGSIAAWLVAAALAIGQRILGVGEVLVASARGASGILMAISILFLAWAIGGVCSDLGTAHVLVAMFKGSLPPFLLPLILFFLACAVSFSTGSSWSTMAILLPNTVILAYTMGADFSRGPLALTVLSIGAVLEGSIFGDHCSPVSDTTILSSVASASDHIDHVRTQMPYAITAMLVAIGIGYLPAAALGISPVISLVVGAAVIVGFLVVAGGDPDRGRSSADLD